MSVYLHDLDIRNQALAEGREQGRTEGLEQGRMEGKHAEALTIASSMLAHGLTEDTIAQCTRLSLEEIRNLKTRT